MASDQESTMQDQQGSSVGQEGRGTELVVGIIISLIVIAIAVYWMYAASTGSVPFVLAFGLPNNLVVNLIILVILAVIVGFVFKSVRSK